ncbi:MAG TPA: efflux RND transporter periplasmic adaptor subunit [Bacteroidota bacterium]|nr:efflux RND transporter periplasmic adaptor subunit [Bacteroidota bacterium]
MKASFPATAVLACVLSSCSGPSDGRIESSGTIEGTDVNIGVEVTGKISRVLADEGARVSAGDTLLVVDDAEYQIQLRQALANLGSYESAYRLAVEGSRKEDVIQAEAAFRTAETDYRRMKTLLAEQTVTQKSYDDAYARFVTAEQTYRKLKAGSRPEEIEGARVRRDQAAAQADLLRKRVRDCHVLSPSAGVITLRSVEPGELVATGMTVFRLTDLDRIKLMIYVNEADLGKVQLGQTALISIDSFGKGKSVEGKVTYISPLAEFTPKNVQTKEERTKLVFGVRIEAANADGALKPGLPADAAILTSAGRH